MNNNVRLLFTPAIYQSVMAHLFRQDNAEHAGALLCGFAQVGNRILLTTRNFVPAVDGEDYVTSPEGHGRLQALFIDNMLTKAGQAGLVYLAIHNHFATDRVFFSEVDFRSHERGYPTFLRLSKGMPVGAAVFGTNSIEVDLWMPNEQRHSLDSARIIGHGIRHLWSHPSRAPSSPYDETFDRQLPFLRASGQGILTTAKIAIIGLGGIGSQLVEPLVRLGVSHFVLIDPDRLETSNYSRVHGAISEDLPREGQPGALKVEIARRVIKSIAVNVKIEAFPDNVALSKIAATLTDCDFVFLAADSAEARFVCNALCHQYFIPIAQLGTKIMISEKGVLQRIFGMVRQIRPGSGCLWCNELIDRAALTDASKSQAQRDQERYGVRVPNPAVVTFNSEVTGRALNDFVMQFASPLVPLDRGADYTLLDFLAGTREEIQARRDHACPFCSPNNERFGMAGGIELPTL